MTSDQDKHWADMHQTSWQKTYTGTTTMLITCMEHIYRASRNKSTVPAGCISPNSITPTSLKLGTGKFQGSRRNGIWAKGDVTGLSWTCRGHHREVGIVEFGLYHTEKHRKNTHACCLLPRVQ